MNSNHSNQKRQTCIQVTNNVAFYSSQKCHYYFTSFKIQASCKAQGVKTTESKYHSWLKLDVIS